MSLPVTKSIFQNASSYIYKRTIVMNIPNLIKIAPVVFAVALDTDAKTDIDTPIF